MFFFVFLQIKKGIGINRDIRGNELTIENHDGFHTFLLYFSSKIPIRLSGVTR